ncbi:CG33632, partial [Drosophila busckii]
FYLQIDALFEFNNVKCRVFDRSYSTFNYCFLRSVNRTYKYLTIHSHIYKYPVDNATVQFNLAKRETKQLYRYLNATLDVCKFLKYRSNPFANFIFSTFQHYTNVNHTCPYDHDLVLNKLPVHYVNNVVQNVLPDGRYVLTSIWQSYKIVRAEISVYFTKS